MTCLGCAGNPACQGCKCSLGALGALGETRSLSDAALPLTLIALGAWAGVTFGLWLNHWKWK